MNIIKRVAYEYCIPFIGCLLLKRNKYINVIYYHDIVNGNGTSFQQTNIDRFKAQMEYLCTQGYKTCRFDDCRNNEPFDEKNLLITFDDGWKSNYEIMDFMKSRGIRYNIFLAVGEIGNNPEYLTWNQVREMHATGLVGFGVHTYSHPDMSNLTNINPDNEFGKADFVFEDELGFAPKDFCYPYGFYSEESNDYISKNCKYDRIYTSSLMYSYIQNGKIIFGRSGISNDEPMKVFKAKVKGYFNIWKDLLNR